MITALNPARPRLIKSLRPAESLTNFTSTQAATIPLTSPFTSQLRWPSTPGCSNSVPKNLLWKTKEKADSSGKRGPWNDSSMRFSTTSKGMVGVFATLAGRSKNVVEVVDDRAARLRFDAFEWDVRRRRAVSEQPDSPLEDTADV